jgi:hypothetical protein
MADLAGPQARLRTSSFPVNGIKSGAMQLKTSKNDESVMKPGLLANIRTGGAQGGRKPAASNQSPCWDDRREERENCRTRNSTATEKPFVQESR